jgi:hypothetical protein
MKYPNVNASILIVAGALVWQGCSSSTSPSSGGNSGPYPSAGSTFTYTYTSVDTNGVTSAPSDSTYTILSDSETYGGKTNVLAVESQDGGISYYHLESNGDISIYVDLSSLIPIPIALPISTNWFIIPIGSGIEQKIVLFDSTIGFPLNGVNTPIEVLVQTDATDLGSWNVSAANASFSSEKGSMVLTASASASVLGLSVPVASYTQTSTIWYSKQLKYYPEREDQLVTGGALLGTPTTTSDTYLLQSYSEK